MCVMAELAVACRAVRIGYWTAVILWALALAAILVTPVVGLLYAAFFLAVAWGIRRGQPWAAITGACGLAFSVVMVVSRGRDASSTPLATLMLALAVNLVAAYLLFGAAKPLWRAEKPENRTFAALRVWPWLLVLAATVLPWLFLRPFSIPTGSMEDTILLGDYILVETVSPRLGSPPRDGDLVVFRYPPDRRQIFVKRIEGAAGDRLHFRNKQLYRNGSPVTEGYARHKTNYIDSYRDNFPSEANVRLYAGGERMLAENVKDGEVVVPPGAYFVLGDNRDASLDSRYWGFVQASDIIGTPVLIYASYDSGNQPGDKGSKTILNFRWERLLKRF